MVRAVVALRLGFFNRKPILLVKCNRTNEHTTSRFRLVMMCAVPRKAAFTANHPGRQVSVDQLIDGLQKLRPANSDRSYGDQLHGFAHMVHQNSPRPPVIGLQFLPGAAETRFLKQRTRHQPRRQHLSPGYSNSRSFIIAESHFLALGGHILGWPSNGFNVSLSRIWLCSRLDIYCIVVFTRIMQPADPSGEHAIFICLGRAGNYSLCQIYLLL